MWQYLRIQRITCFNETQNVSLILVLNEHVQTEYIKVIIGDFLSVKLYIFVQLPVYLSRAVFFYHIHYIE